MKVTFELPAPLVRSLRARISSHEESRFVADALERKLRAQEKSLELAAKKANSLHRISEEMKDWEALNGYEN
jgi:hypothetical protein